MFKLVTAQRYNGVATITVASCLRTIKEMCRAIVNSELE